MWKSVISVWVGILIISSVLKKKLEIQILKSTGWYKEPFIPEEYLNKTTEELASIMIDEIENGIEGTNVKAMMIGEIGTSKNEWKDSERRLFDAAIIAHKKTNRPIYNTYNIIYISAGAG